MISDISNTSVLIIEDNPADAFQLQELIQDSFVPAGHAPPSLQVARNLTEAEHLARVVNYDIVLLDLSLPESRGIDTVRRARITFSEQPVIVLTGMEDNNLAMESLKLGAQDYLIKGSDTAQTMLRALRYALERQRMVASVRKSERSYRAVVQNSPNAIFLVEQDRIEFVNDAGVLLFKADTASQVIGRRLEDLRPDEPLAGAPLGTITERRYCSVGGESFYVEEIVSAIEGAFSMDSARMVVAWDITEKKRVEHRIVQEMEQPLRAIREAASLIHESIDDRENHPALFRERAEEISHHVEQAVKVMDRWRVPAGRTNDD